MARVKTFTNGGSLLPSDLNSIEDDYELAFSSYKTIFERSAFTAAAPASGNYIIHGGNIDPALTVPVGQAIGGGGPASMSAMFPLDPADYGSGTRTVKLRLKVALCVGFVAPAANLTFGILAPGSSATSGQIPSWTNSGSYTTGSTVVFTTPSGNPIQTSGDFTCPAAGMYGLGFTLSANTPANTRMAMVVALQARMI